MKKYSRKATECYSLSRNKLHPPSFLKLPPGCEVSREHAAQHGWGQGWERWSSPQAVSGLEAPRACEHVYRWAWGVLVYRGAPGRGGQVYRGAQGVRGRRIRPGWVGRPLSEPHPLLRIGLRSGALNQVLTTFLALIPQLWPAPSRAAKATPTARPTSLNSPALLGRVRWQEPEPSRAGRSHARLPQPLLSVPARCPARPWVPCSTTDARGPASPRSQPLTPESNRGVTANLICSLPCLQPFGCSSIKGLTNEFWGHSLTHRPSLMKPFTLLSFLPQEIQLYRLKCVFW